MTNPDNIVRVRARLEGRASVYEANGWAQAYKSGILSGSGVVPNTVPDMNVLVGGTADNPDVLIAENADGYKIALDVVGQQPIAITAPASQNRFSAIVAYTDDLSLASTDSATTGSPSSCGLIVVNGNPASTPSAPSDSTIRTAITADGATGSQACYCVIATILVSSSTTAISTSLITPKTATLAGSGVVSATNIDFSTLPGNYSLSEIDTGYTWVDGSHIYKKTVKYTDGINPGTEENIPHGITNFSRCIKIEAFGAGGTPGSGSSLMIPAKSASGPEIAVWTITPTAIKLDAMGLQYTDPIYFTLWYTKTS